MRKGIGTGANPASSRYRAWRGSYEGRQGDAVAQDHERNRLALAGLHVGQQRVDGVEGVTIDGQDGVSGAQAGLLGGRAGCTPDADRAGDELRQGRPVR